MSELAGLDSDCNAAKLPLTETLNFVRPNPGQALRRDDTPFIICRVRRY